ncbi:hypothetical protein BRD17_08475 [Halobacteriales archaeon SW_7_68_16]|nr:MAG: hypothetical protein BRD17_08475 [Halobacteriales archaeon SW_7_68_16]
MPTIPDRDTCTRRSPTGSVPDDLRPNDSVGGERRHAHDRRRRSRGGTAYYDHVDADACDALVALVALFRPDAVYEFRTVRDRGPRGASTVLRGRAPTLGRDPRPPRSRPRRRHGRGRGSIRVDRVARTSPSGSPTSTSSTARDRSLVDTYTDRDTV